MLVSKKIVVRISLSSLPRSSLTSSSSILAQLHTDASHKRVLYIPIRSVSVLSSSSEPSCFPSLFFTFTNDVLHTPISHPSSPNTPSSWKEINAPPSPSLVTQTALSLLKKIRGGPFFDPNVCPSVIQKDYRVGTKPIRMNVDPKSFPVYFEPTKASDVVASLRKFKADVTYWLHSSTSPLHEEDIITVFRTCVTLSKTPSEPHVFHAYEGKWKPNKSASASIPKQTSFTSIKHNYENVFIKHRESLRIIFESFTLNKEAPSFVQHSSELKTQKETKDPTDPITDPTSLPPLPLSLPAQKKEPKIKIKSKNKSKTETKDTNKTKTKTKTKTKNKSKIVNESKSQSENKEDMKNQSKSKTESKTKSKTEIEGKGENKSENKAGSKSEGKNVRKIEKKIESKNGSESVIEKNSNAKSKSKGKVEDQSAFDEAKAFVLHIANSVYERLLLRGQIPSEAICTAYMLVNTHCHSNDSSTSPSPPRFLYTSASMMPALPPFGYQSSLQRTINVTRSWMRVYFYLADPARACHVFQHHMDHLYHQHVHSHRCHRWLKLGEGVVGWFPLILGMGFHLPWVSFVGFIHILLMMWIRRKLPLSSIRDLVLAHVRLFRSMAQTLNAMPTSSNVMSTIHSNFASACQVARHETPSLTPDDPDSKTSPQTKSPSPPAFIWSTVPIELVGYMYAHFPESSRVSVPPHCLHLLLKQYYDQGWHTSVIHLFKQYMEPRIEQFDFHTITTVISSMGKLGQLDKALSMYHYCLNRGDRPNLFILNTLVSVLSRNGCYAAAEAVVQRDFSHYLCTPNLSTYLKLIQRAEYLPVEQASDQGWPYPIDRAWHWYQAWKHSAHSKELSSERLADPGNTLLLVCNRLRQYKYTIQLFPELDHVDERSYVLLAEALARHSESSFEDMVQTLSSHASHPNVIRWVADKAIKAGTHAALSRAYFFASNSSPQSKELISLLRTKISQKKPSSVQNLFASIKKIKALDQLQTTESTVVSSPESTDSTALRRFSKSQTPRRKKQELTEPYEAFFNTSNWGLLTKKPNGSTPSKIKPLPSLNPSIPFWSHVAKKPFPGPDAPPSGL